ncbi:MAG: hypothetical protein ABS46_01555 [Cytophagaceae bacterium SCN 52-12]|nr:MAG: hypothetical protein ABS46_01555 [Cytophagaceae bacterium SCN 52-12]
MWMAIAALFPLYAQHPGAHTLGSLWPEIEERYPGAQARMSAVDAARLNERAVRSNALPQVRAQAQNTYGTYKGSAGGFFPQPGFFNVSGSVPADGSSVAANSFGSATVEWELFSFGRLLKENEAAGALSGQTVSEKDAYLLNLKKTLSERYITLLYHDAKLGWTAKNAERLDSIRYITSGLSAAGLRPAADSLLASSSYVQAMGEHDKWRGLREASFIQLAELYGDNAIDYTASAGRFANPVGDYVSKENTISPSHPLLDVLDKRSRYYTLSGEAQKRSSLPSLQLLGGYSYRGTGIGPNGTVSGAWKDGFSNTTNNVLAGIGITWNITGLHTSRLKGEKLFKDAESTRLLHSQYEQAMQADLSASQVKIGQQYRQLQKTGLAVKQSQDAYRMYLARYRSGIIALSELLQIRMLLEQAENAHIEALRNYWMLLAGQAELTADFDFLFNNL